jgi:hypothetical protein
MVRLLRRKEAERLDGEIGQRLARAVEAVLQRDHQRLCTRPKNSFVKAWPC